MTRRNILLIAALLLSSTAARGQCSGGVDVQPLTIVSVDWWDFNGYQYTQPIGDGFQKFINGAPSNCVFSPSYVAVALRPLRMDSASLNQPLWYQFHWRDYIYDGWCVNPVYYPHTCPGQVNGTLIKYSTGELQPLAGLAYLVVFREYF